LSYYARSIFSNKQKKHEPAVGNTVEKYNLQHFKNISDMYPYRYLQTCTVHVYIIIYKYHHSVGAKCRNAIYYTRQTRETLNVMMAMIPKRHEKVESRILHIRAAAELYTLYLEPSRGDG